MRQGNDVRRRRKLGSPSPYTPTTAVSASPDSDSSAFTDHPQTFWFTPSSYTGRNEAKRLLPLDHVPTRSCHLTSRLRMTLMRWSCPGRPALLSAANLPFASSCPTTLWMCALVTTTASSLHRCCLPRPGARAGNQPVEVAGSNGLSAICKRCFAVLVHSRAEERAQPTHEQNTHTYTHTSAHTHCLSTGCSNIPYVRAHRKTGPWPLPISSRTHRWGRPVHEDMLH